MRFRTYPEYKESGVDWVGQIPSHWAVATLKRLCRLRSGESISPDEINGAGDFAVFGGNGQRGFTSSYTHDGLFPLVGRQGALCGNVNYAQGKFWASEHAVVATPDKAVHPTWLGELLRAMNLNQYTESAAQPGLAVDRIKNIPAPFPSPSEQQQIAAFISYETARIDALVEEQQHLIDLLQEKRQAVISRALTKGLDPDVSMKHSGVEWLGELPEDWEAVKLSRIATLQSGIAKGRSYEAHDAISVPYLRVANVQDGYVDLSDVRDIQILREDLPRYSLLRGDVLMNEGGDNDKLGRGTVWTGEIDPCVHQNHVFAVRPGNRLRSRWLALFTRTDSARSYFYLYSKQSTNLASISSTNILNCRIPLPPRAEQGEILKRLHDQEAKINALESAAANAIDLLDERRAALISAAVTGKIDVRDWKPQNAPVENDLPMVAEPEQPYG